MTLQPSTSWFPFLYEPPSDIEEVSAWIKETLSIASVKKLENFVTRAISGRGSARFATVAHGSFNMIFRFNFPDGTAVALRLPKPNRLTPQLVAERLENEVHWMLYLEEHNLLRVPHVHC